MEIDNKRVLRDYYSTFTILYLGQILLGFDVTFTTFFVNGQSNIMLVEEELAGSISIYSRFIGSLSSIYFSHHYGYKFTVQVCYLINIFSWSFIYFCTKYWQLIIGRIFTGYACGLQPSAIVYVVEIVHQQHSARLISRVGLCIAIGTCISTSIGRYHSWHIIAVVAATISTFGYLLLLNIPESYKWYMSKGRKDDAKKAYQWFSQTSITDEIMFELHRTENSSKISVYYSWYQKANIVFLFPCLGIQICNAGAGRIPILNHTKHFIERLTNNTHSNDLVVSLMWFDLITAFIYSFIPGKINHLRLLYNCLLITGFSLIGIAANDLVLKNFGVTWPLSNIAFIFIYTVLCISGVYTSCNIIITQLTPKGSLSAIMNFSIGAFYIFSGILSLCLPYLLDNVEIHIILLIFLSSLIGIYFSVHILVKIYKNNVNDGDNHLEEIYNFT